MAEEKKTAKKEVTSKAEKKPNIFKRMGKGIARFFKDLRAETKKIVWPGRKMVIKSTGVVLAAILVIGSGIWILDYALSAGISAVEKINITETTEESTESTSDTTKEVDDTKEDAE